VTDGAYVLSRHPMYVAWTALLLGMAFVLRTAWLLLLMPVLAVLIHREVQLADYPSPPSL
jgi:protein-S-isoprenylcysteine O-methyltransferase Ste14